MPNGLAGACSSFPRKRKARADKVQRFVWTAAFAGVTVILAAVFLAASIAAADTIYV